jgi:hypothetical protein
MIKFRLTTSQSNKTTDPIVFWFNHFLITFNNACLGLTAARDAARFQVHSKNWVQCTLMLMGNRCSKTFIHGIGSVLTFKMYVWGVQDVRKTYIDPNSYIFKIECLQKKPTKSKEIEVMKCYVKMTKSFYSKTLSTN